VKRVLGEVYMIFFCYFTICMQGRDSWDDGTVAVLAQ